MRGSWALGAVLAAGCQGEEPLPLTLDVECAVVDGVDTCPARLVVKTAPRARVTANGKEAEADDRGEARFLFHELGIPPGETPVTVAAARKGSTKASETTITLARGPRASECDDYVLRFEDRLSPGDPAYPCWDAMKRRLDELAKVPEKPVQWAAPLGPAPRPALLVARAGYDAGNARSYHATWFGDNRRLVDIQLVALLSEHDEVLKHCGVYRGPGLGGAVAQRDVRRRILRVELFGAKMGEKLASHQVVREPTTTDCPDSITIDPNAKDEAGAAMFAEVKSWVSSAR